MSGAPRKPKQDNNSKSQITILLVDDIPETRESIKKLLAFESDFKVVGAAGTGREGIEMAKDYQPDIIIMDINMPDMDGLQATGYIKTSVPMCSVIIMSVQNDADYMRRAMLAGARDFLTKPVDMDELYNTIRTVYKNTQDIRDQYTKMRDMPELTPQRQQVEGERAGNIIAVYSPKGGVGVTTVATNIASGLMKEGVKVLLVDADLQFGDVATFLFLQAQSTIVEVAEDVDDLDTDLFENIVTTHDSGLKVLVGPSRPEFADELRADPSIVSRILEKVAGNYDFIIVDTASGLDETLMNIFDIANRVLLVTTPTLSSIKHVRFVLDLFDQMNYPPEKSVLVLNQTWEDRKDRSSATVPTEKIQNFLKREVVSKLPVVDERIILSAMNKGVPVIASDRDTSKPLIKQLIELADYLYDDLMGEEIEDDETMLDASDKKRSGIGLLRRR